MSILNTNKTISVSKTGKVDARTHPNAPVIVNFYTVTSRGGKKYNTDVWGMKFVSESGAEWMIKSMNDLWGNFGKTVYYRAN